MAPPPPDPVFILKGSMDALSCIAYGPHETLYAGTQEGRVHVWDLKVCRELCSFKSGMSPCLSINFFHDSAVIQEKGGQISMWSGTGREFVKTHHIGGSYLGFCKLDVELNSVAPKLFVPAEDSQVKIISLISRKVEGSLKYIDVKCGEVMVIKYFRLLDEPFLLVAYESGHILIWDLLKYNCVSELKIEGTPMAVDFDPESRRGVCGTESETVVIFQFDESKKLSLKHSMAIMNPGVSCVSIRPDRKLIAVGGWDGFVRLYSWKTLRPLAVLTEHKETIQDLCFSTQPIVAWKTKYLLAVGSKDKRVSLWNIYSQEILK